MTIEIHPTAEVSQDATIGDGTRIWHHVQIREGVRIGRNCTLSKGVYIDQQVEIGDNVKIQNYVSVYQGVTIADGVFIGPHVCFTNDLRPRAINQDGAVKSGEDWQVVKTKIDGGASIGANATILCGITIGKWALIGAGSVVVEDVPDHGLVVGSPARMMGFVCACGEQMPTVVTSETTSSKIVVCRVCSSEVAIPNRYWERLG